MTSLDNYEIKTYYFNSRKTQRHTEPARLSYKKLAHEKTPQEWTCHTVLNINGVDVESINFIRAFNIFTEKTFLLKTHITIIPASN